MKREHSGATIKKRKIDELGLVVVVVVELQGCTTTGRRMMYTVMIHRVRHFESFLNSLDRLDTEHRLRLVAVAVCDSHFPLRAVWTATVASWWRRQCVCVIFVETAMRCAELPMSMQ